MKRLFFLAIMLGGFLPSFAQSDTTSVDPLSALHDTGLKARGTPSTDKGLLAEELIAIIGDNSIMLSDLERMTQGVIMTRKREGVRSKLKPAEEALEVLLTQKLLSAQARADSLDKEIDHSMISQRVNEEVDRMIEHAGSVRALEKRSGKPIFMIKRDIEKDVIESQLSQMMQNKIQAKTKLMARDVEAFFDKLPKDSLPTVPPMYSYSQIVRVPPQTEERKFKIREQLLDFRKRILAGEKFAVFARMYSQDPVSARNGGEMEPMPIQNFVSQFSMALEELKPNQISEIVETEFGLHLIELLSRKGDVINCRHILMKPEFTVEETDRVLHDLDSLKTAITEGKTTFAAAAASFSEDKETMRNGGEVYNLPLYYQTRNMAMVTTRFAPDEINVLDFNKLSKMKEGEVSDPYMAYDNKGNAVYKITRLDEILPAHAASLDLDYAILEQATKMDKESRDFDAWLTKTINKMYVYISPEYRSNGFSKPEWLRTCEKIEEQTVNNKLPEAYKLKLSDNNNQ